MPAAPQQGGGQSDNSFGILWGVAALFATLGGLWYGFKNNIVAYYLTVKLHELDVLSYLSTHFDFHPNYFDQLRGTLNYAINNPASINFNDMMTLGAGVGEWLRWPFVILMFLFAIAVYVGNTTRVFKRIYSMKDLANLEKVNWPQIAPVVNLDLIKADIDVGPWAMAMTPMQFCKRNRLLEEVRPQRHEGMARKDWDRMDVILKRGEANRLFSLQIGQVWQGTDKLPNYARALFAVFAARINADTKDAAKVLMNLNSSAVSNKLDMTGVDELMKKHEKTKLVQEIVQSHAYVMTVMASMLEGARSDGVQASADFLWLKPLDRRLWYILNTVGRQTPFIEVAGVYAHWVAEKEAGRKLIVPMVDEATTAVEIALKEVLYRPDE